MDVDIKPIIIDEKKQKQFKKMTQTPIVKLIIELSLPAVISMMVTAIYNMADTFFVSKLGTSASGAVGVIFPLMAIIQAVGFMLGSGAGSRISLYLGEGKNDEADRVASTGFFSSVLSGVIIALIFRMFLPQILLLIGSTETILPYAKSYAQFILLGFPIMCASFVMNNLLRAQGKTGLSMIGLTIGGLLNIVLDPIFIFTFNMGIAGAAIATILSQGIGFLILLFFLVGNRSTLKLSFRKISINFETYYTILRLGAPSLLRQGLASIAISILNNRAAVFGDSAVSAISIVNRVTMLILSAMLGVGQGFQPIVGFNYGARFYKRVRSAFRVTLFIGFGMMVIIAGICIFFAPEIMTAFRPDDAEVIRIGAFTLRLQAAVMPLMSITVCTNMLHQSIGKSREATFLATTRQGIYFIPLILILPNIWGLLGVQISQSIADVFSMLTAIPFALRFFRTIDEEDKISNT